MSKYEEAYKEYLDNIKEDECSPLDLVSELPVDHVMFYLQHKDEMKIRRGENGELEYLFKEGNSRLILSEEQLQSIVRTGDFNRLKIKSIDMKFYSDPD